jgi:translation elongation factor EF-1alpha
MDMRTGAWTPEGAMVKLLPKDTQGVVVLQTEQTIACERFEDCKPLGRFVLRQEGETVGGGLIEDLVE